jgi:small subunit ribosomal protein S20
VATRHRSAVKAHRQTLRRTAHNRALRAKLRSALKSIRSTIGTGKTDNARKALREAFSVVDKMAGKGIIHDNAANRYKSRLATRLNKQ